MILSKTPVRIAFGGGGTDVEPYCSDYGGFVINSTINLYFRSMLNIRKESSIKIFSNDKFTAYRFDELNDLKPENINGDIIRAIVYLLKPESGIDIYLHGEPPKKAGLGASASLCSCLIGGIQHVEGKNLDKEFVAEQAYKVEQEILNNIGGRQDQYAAVYGGMNEIEFLGDAEVKVSKLSLSSSFIKELEKRILLFYTGKPHTSGNIVGAQVKTYHENKAQATKSLDVLKNIAYQMKDALLSEDFEQLGRLLSQDWKEKTRFNPLITTEYMTNLNKIVMKNGGIGGRVCGAGGGGCMFWVVKPRNKNVICKKLRNLRGELIQFKFVNKGLHIESI